MTEALYSSITTNEGALMNIHIRHAIAFGIMCGIISGIGIKLAVGSDTEMGAFISFAGLAMAFTMTLTYEWRLILVSHSPYVYNTTVLLPWLIVVYAALWKYVLHTA